MWRKGTKGLDGLHTMTYTPWMENPPKVVMSLEGLANIPFNKAVSNVLLRGEPSAWKSSVVAVLFRSKLSVGRYC